MAYFIVVRVMYCNTVIYGRTRIVILFIFGRPFSYIFRQGRDSPILRKGTSAHKAVELDNLLKNKSANNKEVF